MAPLDQLAAQLVVVVDLPVEDDDLRSVFAENGLAPAREVDDAEAPHPEAHPPCEEQALVVRAAVADRRAHGPDRLPLHGPLGVPVDDAYDAAHGPPATTRGMTPPPCRSGGSHLLIGGSHAAASRTGGDSAIRRSLPSRAGAAHRGVPGRARSQGEGRGTCTGRSQQEQDHIRSVGAAALLARRGTRAGRAHNLCGCRTSTVALAQQGSGGGERDGREAFTANPRQPA